MQGTALYQIQKAIIKVLQTDEQLDVLVSEILDEVPQDLEYPLIQVGEPLENRFDSFDKKGKDVTFQLHIWSKYQGYKEAYQILNRINNLLDYQELEIDGFNTVYIRSEEVNAIRTDREFRQITVNYRIIVQDE